MARVLSMSRNDRAILSLGSLPACIAIRLWIMGITGSTLMPRPLESFDTCGSVSRTTTDSKLATAADRLMPDK